MTKRLNGYLGILVFFLLLSLSSFLFAHISDQNIDGRRSEVLESLKSFLVDPEANFPRIEKIEDLNYWTLIYSLIEDKNYIEELFSKHFQLSGIDENKLNIMFNLLLRYSIDPNPYYGPIALIIDRLIDIMQNRPEWFFENLMKQPEWKEIIRFIWAKDKDKFREYINGLEDRNKKKEFLRRLSELEEETREEYKWLELFLKEPGKYAGDADNIHFWGTIIGYYEQNHLDENKTLLPQYNPILILSDWIKNDPDESKLKVLFVLLQNLTSGYHAEIISDTGAKVFIEHPRLFINCLKDYRQWKYLLFRISYDVYYHIYTKEKRLEDILSFIGNSEFETEVKEEIRFIIGLVNEQIRKIERKMRV